MRASGVSFTILRSGWYSENYGRDIIPTVRETGAAVEHRRRCGRFGVAPESG